MHPASSRPAPRPGRRERHRVEIRERLFRAALALFAERGFHATTVEDITEAADVGKGTFFNYFPAKEQVLGVLAQIQLGKVEAAVKEAQEGRAPVRQVLEKLIHRLAEEPSKCPELFRSLILALQSSPEMRELMARNLARGRAMLAELITQGQERRDIRSDYPPEELARVFQQLFFGTLMLWTLPPPSRLKDRLETGFDLYWSSLAARKKQAKEKHR